MWQMELQTFVCCYLSSCSECRSSARAYFQCDSGMFGRIWAAGSVWPAAFTRLVSTFACLLSLQWRAGMRGMQAAGLPVYSEGFLHCPPAPQLPFEGFFTFLCSLLFWEQVTGSAHGSLLWHSWIFVWLGTAGILSYSTYRSPSYTPEIFLQLYAKQYDTMSSLYPFILSWNLITFVYSFDSFDSSTSAPGLLWNEVIPWRLIPFTTEIDSVLVTVTQLVIVHG